MISLDKLDALIFDFDGVLTNNYVYLGEDGEEYVRCSRGDGLAFSELNRLGIKCFIISSEKNGIVLKRAKKLGIRALNGVKNKTKALKELAEKEGLEISKLLFVGNDLNDLEVMKYSGYSACPSDSHRSIIEIADFELKKKGGEGVVREIIEDILGIDSSTKLY